MQFEEYQHQAKTTAIYPKEGNCLYPLLGLLGEVGEFAEKMEKVLFTDRPAVNLYEVAIQELFRNMTVQGRTAETLKKLLRDRSDRLPADTLTNLEARSGVLQELSSDELIKELGDILWYLAAICNDHGISLDGVAKKNLDKLFSRKARGVLQGSGDNR